MPGATSAELQQVLMYRYITEFSITIHCLQIEINISTYQKKPYNPYIHLQTM